MSISVLHVWRDAKLPSAPCQAHSQAPSNVNVDSGVPSLLGRMIATFRSSPPWNWTTSNSAPNPEVEPTVVGTPATSMLNKVGVGQSSGRPADSSAGVGVGGTSVAVGIA